jgi:hypothetical protein
VLPVFTSTEEADRLELEEHERVRKKWCGLLHPETTVSICYNQLHMVGILYMLIMLPVRTAFDMVAVRIARRPDHVILSEEPHSPCAPFAAGPIDKRFLA